jgi:hypothetical protein
MKAKLISNSDGVFVYYIPIWEIYTRIRFELPKISVRRNRGGKIGWVFLDFMGTHVSWSKQHFFVKEGVSTLQDELNKIPRIRVFYSSRKGSYIYSSYSNIFKLKLTEHKEPFIGYISYENFDAWYKDVTTMNDPFSESDIRLCMDGFTKEGLITMLLEFYQKCKNNS